MGEDRVKEGKEQIQDGAGKIMREGLERGKQQKEKLKYYQENRSDIIGDIAFNFNRQKKPAASGLIVLLPILVVSLVIAWLFGKIDLIPYNELLDLTGVYVIDQSLKLGALLTLGTLLVTATGKFVRTEHGFGIEKRIDLLFERIPFLGPIYRITKVTTETLIEGTEELSKPVKIEIAENQMTAFKTGNTTEDDREILFLPTSPNISSGLILEVKPENIIETDETSEQALTRVLSAGFGQTNENQ